MPDFVGLIKYPLESDRYNTNYGEPEWWRDFAVSSQAEMKRIAQPKAAPAGSSSTALDPGEWLVSDPSEVSGLPSGAGPGVLDITGNADTYVETGTLTVVWLRRRIGGLLSQWTKVAADTIVPHALTRPMAGSTETHTSRSVRIPFQVPVRARRWRIVIRNANYRTNTVYPGAVTLHTVALGGGSRDGNGNLTSSFAPVAGFPSGLRLLVSDTMVEDMGAGWSSGWASGDLAPGTDYMLSIGYQTNGQPVHVGMGGGWQTNGNPNNAGLVNDPTAAAAIRLPFDVRIEYTTDDTAQQDVLIGDSISAGSNATFPVLQAPLAIASRVDGRAARLYGFGGAAFGEWIGANWGDPGSMKWLDVTAYGRADRAVIALGNNDIHAGRNYSQLQADLRALIALVRERVSTNIVVCTVTPRTAWAGTARENIRAAFNDWIRTYPDGITAVADTARAVEDDTGHAPRTDYVTTDGIHFNTAGSTALANAILATSVSSSAAGLDADEAITAYNARRS